MKTIKPLRLINLLGVFSLIFAGAFLFLNFKNVSAEGGSQSSYAGCLKTSAAAGGFFGQFYNFSIGDQPLLGCATGDVAVSLGSGDITSVIAGSGLTGGAASGSATLDIETTYQLPQSCSTDQVVKWNGTAWDCTEAQSKLMVKEAIVGGGTTNNTTSPPGSPVSLPGTTVSYSANEITSDTNLVINWSGRFTNNTAGSHVDTHIYVDGGFVAGTRVVVPIAGSWTQHAVNKVVPVTAGAHTVQIYWNTFGGTATSADTQVVVTAIPN